MGNKRRRFTDEFKIEAVELIEKRNYTLKEASEALGVSENSLSNWKKKYTAQNLPNLSLEEENKQLRKALARAEEEKEILKKALGYFAADDQK